MRISPRQDSALEVEIEQEPVFPALHSWASLEHTSSLPGGASIRISIFTSLRIFAAGPPPREAFRAPMDGSYRQRQPKIAGYARCKPHPSPGPFSPHTGRYHVGTLSNHEQRPSADLVLAAPTTGWTWAWRQIHCSTGVESRHGIEIPETLRNPRIVRPTMSGCQPTTHAAWHGMSSQSPGRKNPRECLPCPAAYRQSPGVAIHRTSVY
jgi:hypothetical protein